MHTFFVPPEDPLVQFIVRAEEEADANSSARWSTSRINWSSRGLSVTQHSSHTGSRQQYLPSKRTLIFFGSVLVGCVWYFYRDSRPIGIKTQLDNAPITNQIFQDPEVLDFLIHFVKNEMKLDPTARHGRSYCADMDSTISGIQSGVLPKGDSSACKTSGSCQMLLTNIRKVITLLHKTTVNQTTDDSKEISSFVNSCFKNMVDVCLPTGKDEVGFETSRIIQSDNTSESLEDSATDGMNVQANVRPLTQDELRKELEDTKCPSVAPVLDFSSTDWCCKLYEVDKDTTIIDIRHVPSDSKFSITSSAKDGCHKVLFRRVKDMDARSSLINAAKNGTFVPVELKAIDEAKQNEIILTNFPKIFNLMKTGELALKKEFVKRCLDEVSNCLPAFQNEIGFELRLSPEAKNLMWVPLSSDGRQALENIENSHKGDCRNQTCENKFVVSPKDFTSRWDFDGPTSLFKIWQQGKLSFIWISSGSEGAEGQKILFRRIKHDEKSEQELAEEV